MGDFLLDRLPARAGVTDMLAAGDFVDETGCALTGGEAYRPHAFVWFHRQLAPEVPAPQPIEVLETHERFVVIDKPHFLATTPRGAHVVQTALVQARLTLDLPELAPAHRLDRLTAGVLVFTTRREFRGAYAGVFQSGAAHKTYDALAPFDPDLEFPQHISNRIEKRRDSLQAEIVDGAPNASTRVEVVEVKGGYARYRLTPATGKTHQLRVHMAALGLPILGDSLYPSVVNVATDDFRDPLQLIARSLSFVDPVDGTPREFTSLRELRWPEERA
ncbi:pseudouridylate synthase [Demequina sp. TTPB684]|uniref:pseudouridine synthase n=1 Tax=unclassified Demequina TaxID=2620311 RepID=UPI001CF532C1|nr:MULTISPECIES: pseudouridine synthase [unclassified Demequina]MCB2411499.1 pseudouridylate synthase [Demequina sp. TTPB684]UPU87314.1 pseudouridine synthase [Demequina sp. TMPB413]